jgi:hypothetical protein
MAWLQAAKLNKIDNMKVMWKCMLELSINIKVRISWRHKKEELRTRMPKARSESKRSCSILCRTGGIQAIMPLTNNIFQRELGM